MMHVRNTILALGLAIASTGAHAQVHRKPDRQPDRTHDRYHFDANRWEKAYQRAGEPRVLVMTGIAGAERPGRGVGSSLGRFDHSGDAAILRSEIERTLLEGRGVRVSNFDALTDRDRRDVELLLLNREREAADLAGLAERAPLVLVARMQPGQARGVKYRVSFEAIDTSRARTVSTVAFDWHGGDDASAIKQYARLLASDFLDGYERHIDARALGTPYTVRLLGADIRDVRRLTEWLETARRVARVSVEQRQQGRITSITEMTVRYLGSAFELAGDIVDAGDLNGLSLDSLDMTSGTITLRVLAGSDRLDSRDHAYQRPASWRFRGPRFEFESLRSDEFTQAYDRAGQPRIAMMIGRSLSPWELRQPWFVSRRESTRGFGDVNTALGGSNVFITIADDIHNTYRDAPEWWGGVVTPDYTPRQSERGLLETKRLENLMLDRLGPGGLGVRMVDAVILRERTLTQNPRLVFREAEIIELVRESDLADIVILGDGRLERGRGYSTVIYTLRAVDLRSGEVLAVAPAAVEVDDRAEWDEIESILGALADSAVARIKEDLAIRWSY